MFRAIGIETVGGPPHRCRFFILFFILKKRYESAAPRRSPDSDEIPKVLAMMACDSRIWRVNDVASEITDSRKVR